MLIRMRNVSLILLSWHDGMAGQSPCWMEMVSFENVEALQTREGVAANGDDVMCTNGYSTKNEHKKLS